MRAHELEPQVRVTDKASGHQYTIPERLFDPEKHKKTGKPALGPDGLPAPPKYKTNLPAAAAGEDEKKETT